MNRQNLRDLLKIIAVAGFWYVAGLTVGLVAGYPAMAGLIGLVIGLFWLAALIKDERRRRLFFEGPYEYEEDTDFLLGCLWVTPLTIMILALMVGLVLRL
jgi:hypothetical protein